MSDEWINIFDKLPNIYTKVEVKIEGTYLTIPPKSFLEHFGNKFYWANLPANYNVTHWRPIQEKRPDFGKLKKGDQLVIEYFLNNKEVITGFIKEVNENIIILSREKIGIHYFDYQGKFIKKITRIDLEKQTFEEI